MDVDLAAIIPQLAKVPVCAHPAYGALIAGPCGPDLECICSNDKFFITLQGVLAIGNCTPSEAQTVHYGCGKHILMLDMDQITGFSKAFFATLCVFATACLALKFSILFFYHRIFAVRKFTICVNIISAICIAWYIASIVSSFLICRPLNCWWDKSNPDCKCINATHVGYFITSPPDIISNLAILILPIPWLWNLQMQTRKK
ncbi:MAG: hypothetical protein Q9177_003786, partial [Variospora cf. flavescens]